MKHPARKQLGFQLMLAARLHRTRTAVQLETVGLFPGQEQTLQALAASDGVTMGDLSQTLRVRPPTISKTIARLTAQGLVERRASAKDGRVVRVHLTDEGRAKLSAIEELSAQIESELLDILGDKDAKRLRKLLRELSRGLAGIVDPDGAQGIEEMAGVDGIDAAAGLDED